MYAVVGTLILALCFMAFRVRMGWIDGFWPHFGEFLAWIAVALILSKTIKRPLFRRASVKFRQIIIISSMVFGTIATNASIHYAQQKVFGRTYVASYEDPKPVPGSNEKTVVPTISQKLVSNFVSVAGEEILFRWIILGSLFMVLPPTWSVLISSLIFGLMHMPVRIMTGYPLGGLASVLPTFAIGIFCGIAFMRYGLAASITIHFLVNLVGWFAYNQTYIADIVIFGSAFVALFILPLTIWVTRQKREPTTMPRPQALA